MGDNAIKNNSVAQRWNQVSNDIQQSADTLFKDLKKINWDSWTSLNRKTYTRSDERFKGDWLQELMVREHKDLSPDQNQQVRQVANKLHDQLTLQRDLQLQVPHSVTQKDGEKIKQFTSDTVKLLESGNYDVAKNQAEPPMHVENLVKDWQASTAIIQKCADKLYPHKDEKRVIDYPDFQTLNIQMYENSDSKFQNGYLQKLKTKNHVNLSAAENRHVQDIAKTLDKHLTKQRDLQFLISQRVKNEDGSDIDKFNYGTVKMLEAGTYTVPPPEKE